MKRRIITLPERCTKMTSLVEFGLPFFDGLLGKPDLESLFIMLTHKINLELVKKRYLSGQLSSVKSLNLYVAIDEEEIYPAVVEGFPNLVST
jgi:hypothetical protein